MNDELKQKLIRNILNRLSSQKFSEWYNSGNFDRWIRGELPSVTDEQIQKEIESLFLHDLP